LPGGAAYSAYIGIWDLAAFPIDPNSPPFFNLPGNNPGMCGEAPGLLGFSSAFGLSNGGLSTFALTTHGCSGEVLSLAPRQQFVVHKNLSLFTNRGGWIDARNTFRTAIDPTLPAETLAILSAGLEAAGPSVPEPASWAMLIAGFGLRGANLRRLRALAALAQSR